MVDALHKVDDLLEAAFGGGGLRVDAIIASLQLTLQGLAVSRRALGSQDLLWVHQLDLFLLLGVHLRDAA